MTTKFIEGLLHLRHYLRQHNINVEDVKLTITFPKMRDKCALEMYLCRDLEPLFQSWSTTQSFCEITKLMGFDLEIATLEKYHGPVVFRSVPGPLDK